MTRNETIATEIVDLIRERGIGYDDQIKVLSMARVAIQPRMSQTDWRAKAKPILRPKEKGKKVEK